MEAKQTPVQAPPAMETPVRLSTALVHLRTVLSKIEARHEKEAGNAPDRKTRAVG